MYLRQNAMINTILFYAKAVNIPYVTKPYRAQFKIFYFQKLMDSKNKVSSASV